MEAEAIGKDGQQKAAMVWARGANMIMNKPRVSRVSDAHSLASNFGNDFSKMLVKGKSPFKGWPSLPSGQKIRSSLGGKPKYLECDRFGRAPGIPGAVADELGFPPDWTDKGARYVLP
uniref:Uncharacterized protein n=1 Tax=Panagrolaimus sp. ES5 TaxID=591445 RepID=A0AC34FSN9_9BILA